MTKTMEKLYLYLAWFLKAYRHTPSQDMIAEACGISVVRVENMLRDLAKAGYIELYVFPDKMIDIKLKIDPIRPWVANIRFTQRGTPILTSEIPLKLYIWPKGSVVPVEAVSEPDLLKEQLKKKGIKV